MERKPHDEKIKKQFHKGRMMEVKVTMEEYIENWEIDGCEDVHEDLFDIEILEV